MSDLKLFSMPSSGNSYKVRLLLSMLGMAYTHIPCEVCTPALEKAKEDGSLPHGKLPALHLTDGAVLTESSAILWHLATGTKFLPADPMTQARILEWMFFEQNRMENVIAIRASLNSYSHLSNQATPERMAELEQAGIALFELLEKHLGERTWMFGSSPSIADIAMFGYTHSSGTRGGYEMSPFPAIASWCDRIKALPDFIALDHQP